MLVGGFLAVFCDPRHHTAPLPSKKHILFGASNPKKHPNSVGVLEVVAFAQVMVFNKRLQPERRRRQAERSLKNIKESLGSHGFVLYNHNKNM